MNNKTKKTVRQISPYSPLAKTPLREGDEVLALNGNENFDIIDYLKLQSESSVKISWKAKDTNKTQHLTVKKEEYEPLGLSFEHFTIDKPKLCHNDCIFCFMAQMPGGMRPTLTFKDDDYRLSFTDGNYITLTNVTDEELQRIIDHKLSPINISVHTTNPELRVKMMRQRKAAKINEQLKKLSDGGICFNAQIVLCPGYNDGDELKRTLEDMRAYAPHLTSLSVVPVGLTKFRENLTELTSVDQENAKRTIEIIESFHEDNLKEFSTRLFFPSDELFILAGKDIPGEDYYEEFIQFENGVGMISSFRADLDYALEDMELKETKTSVSLVCGALAHEYYKEFVKKINTKFPHIKIDLEKIENDFFGRSITVTGLICARDIIKALQGKSVTNLFVLDNMLDAANTMFLDDISVEELEKELSTKITVVHNNGFDLAEAFENLQ